MRIIYKIGNESLLNREKIPKIEMNCLEFLCNSVIICIFANERCNYINLHKR